MQMKVAIHRLFSGFASIVLVAGCISISVCNAHETLTVIRKLLDGATQHLSHHKDLFPLDNNDYFGVFFVILGLMIAAAGGIGGGGIIVPLLIIVFEFEPKFAIPLSNFTILGCSLMNVYLNMKKRHPNVDRPLVDWDLIMVMEPLTMAGAVFGAYLSKILPDWFLVISLMLVLGYTTNTTLRKGISLYKKESAAHALALKSELVKAQAESEEAEQSQSLLSDEERTEQKSKATMEMDPELKALIESEKSTSIERVVIMSVMFIVVVTLNLVKGGGGTTLIKKSDIDTILHLQKKKNSKLLLSF